MGGRNAPAKRSVFNITDTMHMRKALGYNLGEEKRAALHIRRLQKALNTRFQEIEKEKVALMKFLEKLHQTTGYYCDRPSGACATPPAKSSRRSLSARLVCVPCSV